MPPFTLMPQEAEVTLADLHQALLPLLRVQLRQLVDQRSIGHCVQVTDLPLDLMQKLCQQLREERPFPCCEAYVLAQYPHTPWEITATRLIERRNAGEAVLVIFLPPMLRTGAQDSFDITTFERLPIKDIYQQLRFDLQNRVSSSLRKVYFEIIQQSGCDDKIAICRYLLAVLREDPPTHAMMMCRALFYLGLIPDLTLLDDAAAHNDPRLLQTRLARNRKAVEILSSSDRGIMEKIQNSELKLRQGHTTELLYRLFSTSGSSDPARWLPRILAPDFAALAFDQWDFAQEIGERPPITIEFTGFKPEERNEDKYLTLDPIVDKQLKVIWSTSPSPTLCETFQLEIMREGLPIGATRRIKAGKTPRKERSSTFQNLHKLKPEEGLHYIRITAFDADGALLASADSEQIYFTAPGERSNGLGEKPETSAPKKATVASRYEAMIRHAADHARPIRGGEVAPSPTLTWDDSANTTSGRYTATLTFRYPRGEYALPINALLREIEIETLTDIESLGRYRIDLRIPFASKVTLDLLPTDGADESILDDFLQHRRNLFEVICQQDGGIVEALDMLPMRKLVLAYVQAYERVLALAQRTTQLAPNGQQQGQLRYLVNIDCVQVQLPDGQEAYLMGPTHPLKLAWNLAYSEAAHGWIDQINVDAAKQLGWAGLKPFLSRLVSLNVPGTVLNEQGDILLCADIISPFWSIYLASILPDQRVAVGRIKALLGSSVSDERITTVTGADLAAIARRYLVQHPYVTTLVINAIQPGTAKILVDMLLDLQKRTTENENQETPEERHLRALRYRIHLFGRHAQPDELGSALDELMNPSEARSETEAVDAFRINSGRTALSKLTYLKADVADFKQAPEMYEAHLTLVFDVFTTSVEFDPPMLGGKSFFLGGLLQRYCETFSDTEGEIQWKRQIMTDGDVHREQQSPLFAQTVAAFQQTVAALCHAELGSIPTIRLHLRIDEKNLISQVHQISDWVVTVDRHFGLEYLDNPYSRFCPAYLIDYQPNYLNDTGHRLLISTGEMREVEQIVQPVMRDLDLPIEAKNARVLVNALRSVSGRLVLKLLAAPRHANGTIAMAFARLFLDQVGVLDEMLLIPLDAHIDLFANAAREPESMLSLSRSDMLLVGISHNTLVFHLIEVKFRRQETAGLHDEIASQVMNTQAVLARLYDATNQTPDRIDRAIRTLELANLLQFYLDRSMRYRLINPKVGAQIRQSLYHLESGYELTFMRHGVILAMDAQGYTASEEQGVQYHTLGADRLLDLLIAGRAQDATPLTSQADPRYTHTRMTFVSPHALMADPAPASLPVKELPIVDVADSPAMPPSNPISLVSVEHLLIPKVPYDIMVGTSGTTPQYGILGQSEGRTIAMDLNGTHTISVFGVQGSGKSYTVGSLIEMATTPIPHLNQLPHPLATVVFHYSKAESYPPEYVSMLHPNTHEGALIALRERYGVAPQRLDDVVIFVPETSLVERQQEFPHVPIYPLLFNAAELDSEGWNFLMGSVGNSSAYLRVIQQGIRRLGKKVSYNTLFSLLASDNLTPSQREMARQRLTFVKEYLSETQFMHDLFRPGRLVIIDMRSPSYQKDEVLGLFMTILKIFAGSKSDFGSFNKLVVFDEAHQYMDSPLINDIVELVRIMRHQGTSVIIASQDPKSVPQKLIELSSQVILHKFSSPDWLKHIQRGITALSDLTAGRLNHLERGQAYVWSREATNPALTNGAIKIELRPRVTLHGGETLLAERS